MSYNAEIRAKHFTPNTQNSKNSLSKNSPDEITYDENTFPKSVATSNLPTDVILKVELLDNTSTHFKNNIVSFPNASYSQKYYKITALNNYSNQTTITLLTIIQIFPKKFQMFRSFQSKPIKMETGWS